MGFAVHLWDSEGCLQTFRCCTASSHMCCPGIGLLNSWAPLPALTLAAAHVCVCVCVWERKREREREREITSDPPWMSVLWLYLLPGWPWGGVDKVPWKAGPGVLQVQIHDQLWALQEEAVRSGTHSGTRNLGQHWQLIHRKVEPALLQITEARTSNLLLAGGEWQCHPVPEVRESWVPKQPYQCVMRTVLTDAKKLRIKSDAQL